MSQCPKGKICFSQEIIIISLFFIGALIIFGYNKNPHVINFTEPLKDFFPTNNIPIDNNNMQSNPGAPLNTESIEIKQPQIEQIIYDDRPKGNIQIDIQSNTPINEYINEPRRNIPVLLPTGNYDPSIPISKSINTTNVMPINIPTRGYVTKWEQVGILHSLNRNRQQNHILQLFGKPTYPGSSKWNYFASSDGYQTIKLPIIYKGKKATYEYGCEELSEGDVVRVPAYGQRFRVNLYELNQPTYIPYV